MTLRRHDLAAEVYHVKRAAEDPAGAEPGRGAAPAGDGAAASRPRCLLSLGYGCGLRAGEVVRLKVGDIDSAQMIIRVVQAKGRKDRHVMLPPEMLDSAAAMVEGASDAARCGRAAEERWLFPGRSRAASPMTTRQLNRLFHEAAEAAGIRKRVTLHTLRHSFATHLLERGIDIRVIQALLGHDKLDTTARYTRVATGMIANIESPLDRLSAAAQESRKEEQEDAAAGANGRVRVPSSSGGRGHLPRPRCRLA